MASYGRLCTEFYDLDKPVAPAATLAFYIDRAQAASGRVLEPMCGSGRFLPPMAQAGLPVDGLDSSPAMLEACRARAHSLGLSPSVYLQDWHSFNLPHKYTMAFVTSGWIGLVKDDSALRRGLSRLRAHFEANGSLLLEVMDQDDQFEGTTAFQPRTVSCSDGSTITYTCVASRAPKSDAICFSGVYEKRRGMSIAATEVEELTLRMLDVESLATALCACGFNPPRVYGKSELTFLGESGCTLAEARTDA